jgi:UDPglucose 6-dehydrogenase
MRVAVVGAGYVGLATTAALAWVGHEVTCLEVDPSKLEQLHSGRLPVHEPYLGELLALVRDRVCFTDRYEEGLRGARVAFLCVGTPPGADGSPDVSQVRAAARSLGEALGPEPLVVATKSTAPVGNGNWVASLVREAYRRRNGGGNRCSFAVASTPEFLREGKALQDALYPDRVVVGADEPWAVEVLQEVLRPVLAQDFPAPPFLPRPESRGPVPLVVTDLVSAELVKYAANAFLAVRVSFANEVAELAERVGADVRAVLKGIGLDHRVGPHYLEPGVGWGGSCLGKDTAALLSTAREYGLDLPLVAAARSVNDRQRERVVRKLQDELRVLKGRVVGLLGLAFKPDTDDLRDSPALDVARRLAARGALVRAHDPVALPRARAEYPDLAEYCDTVDELAEEADALVLLTAWPEYLRLPWAELAARMRTRLVLDGRNVLDREALAREGLRCVWLHG